ncbi:hypothetical protein [Acidovorax sp. NCPPB 3576]|uniref:hypothetical protein n=1 Tax=Acidovorax sp. NCPPB 3576 TaxID=2940488 RepID=UPI0023499857|nr:hypothetical protein [Acidovorax sp. NCPPB 3576]WCM91006.1 hypothetical protein M5C98_05845 [Acidovorax sp. NCPPB 3576]
MAAEAAVNAIATATAHDCRFFQFVVIGIIVLSKFREDIGEQQRNFVLQGSHLVPERQQAVARTPIP